MQYSSAIKHRRVRAATVLPALIGARTLALLDEAGPASAGLQRAVRVPRREVRGMIFLLATTFASRKVIDAIFARAYRK
jgi:farnesyl-diphosphate farnesyltransferase